MAPDHIDKLETGTALQRVEVASGVALFHRAPAGNRAGGRQQALGQRGFAGGAVADSTFVLSPPLRSA